VNQSEQRGQCSTLGGGQCPAGFATDEAKLSTHRERVLAPARFGDELWPWRRGACETVSMLKFAAMTGGRGAVVGHRLDTVARSASSMSRCQGAASPSVNHTASAGLPVPAAAVATGRAVPSSARRSAGSRPG